LLEVYSRIRLQYSGYDNSVEFFERQQSGERAILVSVSVQLLDDLDAEEFRLLAQSAGAEILEHISVQRNKPDPKFFIGSGKVDEIAELVQQLEAELVIFDHSLSPAQERNLERILKCRVIDRTGLIFRYLRITSAYTRRKITS